MRLGVSNEDDAGPVSTFYFRTPFAMYETVVDTFQVKITCFAPASR